MSVFWKDKENFPALWTVSESRWQMHFLLHEEIGL